MRIHWLAIALLLTLTACEGRKTERTTDAPAPDAETPAETAAVPEPEVTTTEVTTTEEDPVAEPVLDVETVRKVAGVAAEIQKDPSRVVEILAESGVGAEQLEGILYDIASEPTLTTIFEEARRIKDGY